MEETSSSIPACNSIECLTDTAAPDNSPKHPMNYFVPNFGLDTDVADTQSNIALAERTYKHKLYPDLAKKAALV